MFDLQSAGKRLTWYSWVALLVWQLAWHGVAPAPIGNRSWTLVLLSLAPLLVLTPGILQARPRTQFWAMFLIMLYFVIGVTEAWSNPDQRLAAAVQIVITLGFFSGLVLSNRPANH